MAIKKCYSVNADISGFAYEFISEGPKGSVRKQIEFSALSEDSETYNLAFGDVDSDQTMNDMVRSNNLDTEKVLATVAFCVQDFLDHNPGATVLAIGSTLSRTRLYRMAITSHIQYVLTEIEIQGFTDGNWEYFKAGTDYQAFKVRKKSLGLYNHEKESF